MYVLDAKKDKTKRMWFMDAEKMSVKNRTAIVQKGQKWRDTFTVYLAGPNIHDKLTSLDAQVKKVTEERNFHNFLHSNVSLSLCPGPLLAEAEQRLLRAHPKKPGASAWSV